jgi:MIP family channel proteins
MKAWQKYAAEAFGTFVLVGIGCGVVMGEALASGSASGFTAAFGFGFAWLAALYTVGRISGGHFNPVLSLAAYLDRAISARDMLAYWVAQFVGAIGALGIFAWLFSADATAAATNGFNPGFGGFKAFSVEAILTLILTAAFLTMMRSGAHTRYLGMGFSLFAVTLFGYGVTTAGMNPVRTLGPAIYSGQWTGVWVYLVGPLVGAIAGWVLYRLIVRGDTKFTDDLGAIAE